MIKREYGNTGKMISVVGFGGMRFAKDDYTNDQEKCAELVKYAVSKGINFFDTAPTYCEGQSEICLGKAFQTLKREDFVISTKVQTDNDKNAQTSYETICKSLERLKVSKLDFSHAWCIKTFEQFQNVIKPGGVYEGMLKAKEEGLVDVLSFSTHMAGEDIARAAKAYPDIFSGVLLGYNAMNYAYREDGIKAFAELNKGIVIMNPLGGGLIPQNPDKFSYLAKNGDTVATGALKFLTSQTRITSALSGMSSFEEIDNNIKAVENLYKEDEILNDINNNSVKIGGFNEVCTLCSYCNHCPVGINPHKLMFAYNQKILKDDPTYAINQIKWHFGLDAREARLCIGCGKCEKLCTQKLPIIERLKDIQNLISDWD